MLPNIASKYRSVQITTCSPAQLVSMLYDGALRFVREAMLAMEAKDHPRTGERINRAHAIIEHLATGVDPSHDPLLAQRLLDVYAFCMRRLVDANALQDPTVLGEVIRALDPLADAWRQVSKETHMSTETRPQTR